MTSAHSGESGAPEQRPPCSHCPPNRDQLSDWIKRYARHLDRIRAAERLVRERARAASAWDNLPWFAAGGAVYGGTAAPHHKRERSLRCRLGWHDWSIWTWPANYRHCFRCQKVQREAPDPIADLMLAADKQRRTPPAGEVRDA